VSPAIAKTTDEDVIVAARKAIEQSGADALSMQAVANVIGVSAPSLYKRFPDRAGLLARVERQVLAELATLLERAARRPSPIEQLEAMARTYRRFARANPRLYAMLYSGALPQDDEGTAARRKAAQPALAAFAAIAGEDQALPRARALTAFLHGFVSMEIAGEFRLGPGVDDAFELGLSLVLAVMPGKRKSKP
jgi:AcrR family transcriptional regulator